MLRVYSKDRNARLVYYNIVGLIFGFYLHGFGAIWLYLIVIVNYAAGNQFAGKKLYPLFVWIGNLGFLILAEYYHGFEFGNFSSHLKVLDDYGSEMGWHHVSNLRMLNIVSFCIDWHWAR
jgi:hypothetical protein